MEKIKKFFKVKNNYYAVILVSLATLLFVLGVGAIFVRQPTSWYDEEIHYVRSIQIANGDILKTKNNDNTKYGEEIKFLIKIYPTT